MKSKLFLAILTMFCGIVTAFSAEDKITVTVGGMTIADVPFQIETIRTANSKIVKAETVSNMQVRFMGLSLGKTDVQIIGRGSSKVFSVEVQDNIREVYNAIRRDMDSIPEVDISINRNKVVLKGEISSLKNWELLHKILPNYGAVIMDLTSFVPAPEVMVNLNNALQKAGFKLGKDAANANPGEIVVAQEGNTLIVSGSVYSESDIKQVRQIFSTQPWLESDPAKKSNKVRLVEKIQIAPTLLDVGVVFMGISRRDSEAIGSNLMKNGIQVGNAFNFGTNFHGSNQNYALNASLNTVLNLAAETGANRFRHAGHLTFMSNESPSFKRLHNGGTLKVRVYGGSGGTGTLNDVQYGFMMAVKGGLTGVDRVKLDMELEMSSPTLMVNNDYDLKTTKISTTVSAKLGQTLVIGGLKEMVQATTDNSGIPFLRKVPVLNWFVAESGDELTDRQVLILIYPQIAGKGPEIKIPPSAETADTVKQVEKGNKERIKKENSKKSFWQRIF